MAGLAPYLQLLSQQALQLAYGNGSFVGNGTSQQGFGVATGLGRQPKVAFVITTELATWYAIWFAASGTDTAGWTAIATSGTFSAAHTYTFAWLAIG